MLDPGGVVRANVALERPLGTVYAMALDASGDPTLFSDGYQATRTNPTGAPDPSFALSLAPVAPTSPVGAFSGAYQSTGALVLAGDAYGLARVTARGALDTSFGERGALPIAFGAMVVDASDRIYVAVTATLVDAGRHRVIVRYTPDGVLDAGFGDQGVVDLGEVPSPGAPASKVVLAASPTVPDVFLVEGYGSRVWVTHVSEHGVDGAYAGGTLGYAVVEGPASIDGSPNDPGFDLSAAAAGRSGELLLTGIGLSHWYLARLTPGGSIDVAYADGGWVTTSSTLPPVVAGETHYVPAALAVAPDGSAVTLSERFYPFADNAIVCRYTP